MTDKEYEIAMEGLSIVSNNCNNSMCCECIFNIANACTFHEKAYKWGIGVLKERGNIKHG